METQHIIEKKKYLNNDDVIANLKVISKINKGDKLCTENNILEIENSYIPSFNRYWNGNSRKKTLKFFNLIIDSAFKIIDDTYSSAQTEQKTIIKPFSDEESRTLQTFLIEFNGACEGLNNLKETYSSDVTTSSSLQIIIEKLNVRTEKIRRRLTLEYD